MSLARRWHTFGGRRIEDPRGGTPPATPLREHLAHRCQDAEAQTFEADVPWLGKISAIFVFEWPNDAGQVGGKVFATQEKPSGIVRDVQNLRKSTPDPPNSSPGASKIEPRALQD